MNPVVPDPPEAPEPRPRRDSGRPSWWVPGYDDQADEKPAPDTEDDRP